MSFSWLGPDAGSNTVLLGTSDQVERSVRIGPLVVAGMSAQEACRQFNVTLDRVKSLLKSSRGVEVGTISFKYHVSLRARSGHSEVDEYFADQRAKILELAILPERRCGVSVTSSKTCGSLQDIVFENVCAQFRGLAMGSRKVSYGTIVRHLTISPSLQLFFS